MRFEFKVFMLLVESRGFPELAQERNEHDVDFPLKSRLSIPQYAKDYTFR